ncbi:MAG: GNAT family N-acetyltransferase [Clostridia bacterium]|nr:GNAT family N-acetyltransferase [Clostridia bacterium]
MTNDISIELFRENKYEKELVAQIVDIHMQTFTGFFLTFLGRGFLKELYKGFCTHEKSGLIIARSENGVVGFLAFSEDLSAFYKYLIKKSLLPFMYYGLGAFFRKPAIMARLVRSFLKPAESKRAESYVELSSIGVSPEAENKHIGRRMLNKLLSMYDGSSEFEYIKLETDAVNNEKANHFYAANKFVLCDTYQTKEGRQMNEYRYSLRN